MRTQISFKYFELDSLVTAEKKFIDNMQLSCGKEKEGLFIRTWCTCTNWKTVKKQKSKKTIKNQQAMHVTGAKVLITAQW